MAAEADDRSDECSQSTIEADANAEQTSTVATDFASVVSTIPNFVYENGRRYQGYCVDQYVRYSHVNWLSIHDLPGLDIVT